MTKFGLYIKSCLVAKYEDKYIAYDALKDILERRTAGMLDGMQAFYPKLDETYTRCRNFVDEWVQRVHSSSPRSVADILELNQFIHLNQEALRKIIKKHDKNNPACKLLLMWRCLFFLINQRCIVCRYSCAVLC
jgi:SPX domain protein involved in polyphosphate accumulation